MIRHFRPAWLLPLVLLLASCASTPQQKAETACASFNAALEVLTVANKAHKLTDAQQRAISKAVAVVEPVCTGASPPTADVTTAVALLVAIAAEVK